MAPRPDPYLDLAETRRQFRRLVASSARADAAIATDALAIPGPAGTIPLVRFQPVAPRGPNRPLALYFHGGGFAYGSAADAELAAARLVPELDATVISVEYRLAPEHPYPAGLDDCYAALVWAAAHAAWLGCDATRLVVIGPSAGGCLAAATALLARDRGGPRIALQCLQIPALDDRRASAHVPAHVIDDPRLVNRQSALRTWDVYLDGRADVPSYAAPLRAGDLSGLPPAYIQTCELDPYRDDGIDYARRLLQAGVSTELYNVPGAFHAFELFAPDARLTREVRDHWMAAMRRGLATA